MAESSPFRRRTFARNVWPPLARQGSGQVWAAYRDLDRTQWLTPDAIETRQLRQVRSVLRHAIAHVPYYRDLAAERGIVAGEVITEIAQESVSSPQQVLDRISALKEQGRKNALLMLASKSGELRFVTIRMD